jgi:alpha-tubulin suppressor-like RCC1 family protein
MRSVLLPYLAPLLLAPACEAPFVIHHRGEIAGSAGALSGSAGEPTGDDSGTGGTGGTSGAAGGGGVAGSAAGSGEPSAAGAAGDAGLDELGVCEHPLTALTIAAGENHACAVESATGNLFCWGLGSNGQLGNGKTESAAAPVKVQSNESFTDVRVGAVTTCALSTDQELFCFGDNFDGVLADGTSQGSALPVRTLVGAETFSVSSSYVLATTFQRQLFAWGSNTNGQLGLGDASVGDTVRLESDTGLTARGLAAGYSHACLIDEPSRFVRCSGNNLDARLGIAGASRSTFTETLAEPVTQISAGYDRSCALTATGLKCWGHNLPATFEGKPDDLATPTLVSDYMDWQRISVGFDHLCATTTFDRVLCSGDNTSAELGRGGATSPHFEEPETSFSANYVSAGRDFTCALRANDSAVVCWGSNEHGKLGRGSSDESPGAPALVCLPSL